MPPSLASTSGMPNKDRSFHEAPEKAGADELADGTDALTKDRYVNDKTARVARAFPKELHRKFLPFDDQG